MGDVVAAGVEGGEAEAARMGGGDMGDADWMRGDVESMRASAGDVVVRGARGSIEAAASGAVGLQRNNLVCVVDTYHKNNGRTAELPCQEQPLLLALLAAGEVLVGSRDHLTTTMVAKRHTLQDELQGIPDAIKNDDRGKNELFIHPPLIQGR